MPRKKGVTKAKIGRKALWDELDMASRLDSIRGWALEGSTDEEIYTMLGVSKDTFYKWKNEKPEFKEAIKHGKDHSNGLILNSAYKQTQGYYVTVTEPMKVKDQYGGEYIEMVTYDKFIPANNTMTLFMLKNRLPHKYKDKQQIEHEGTVNITFVEDLEE